MSINDFEAKFPEIKKLYSVKESNRHHIGKGGKNLSPLMNSPELSSRYTNLNLNVNNGNNIKKYSVNSFYTPNRYRSRAKSRDE